MDFRSAWTTFKASTGAYGSSGWYVVVPVEVVTEKSPSLVLVELMEVVKLKQKVFRGQPSEK